MARTRSALARRIAVVALTIVVFHARGASADDVLHIGAASADRATIVTAGIQLTISGDDDHDAQVSVRWRKTGDVSWRDAMPLFRVHPEDNGSFAVPEQFAGSIFELAPGTSYDVELHATDPDGPVDVTLLLAATTRPLPSDPASPTIRPVGTASELQAALDSAAPGDVITLADGVYHGPFELSANGTAADPIVIRGASQIGAVIDGANCDCNLLEITSSFVHVERLTLRNARTGLRLKGAGNAGNVARRLLIRNVVNAIVGDPDQRDFYLCDNVLEGRLAWPLVYVDDGARHANDDGIAVQGEGHVVCHNVIVGFGDAMKIEEDGSRAVDFYGNDVLSAYDNGVELDGSAGNTRAFRNRFTNTFVPISVQPIFGGPAYVVRNVIVNSAEEPFKLYARGTDEPNGVLVLHNTSVRSGPALFMQSPATSHHFRFANNLFYGTGPVAADWTGPIDDGAFDYDGWFPDGTFDFHAAGSWPSFAAMQAGGVFESNGTLLDLPIFASGLVPPSSYRVTMTPPHADLASGSSALDRGTLLANLDDGFTGSAPDLGALEAGCPTPLFGVRPLGIDETNEPYGCGGPVEVAVPVLVQTTSLKLKDSPAKPASRKITFKSSTRADAIVSRVVPPAAGSAGDPTLHGATLTIYNSAGSGESVTIVLPASGWTRLGSASSPGYKFRGAAGDPVKTVLVKRDRLNVKGGGASFAYTLDEPSQGGIAVRLTLGTDDPWCADAPAKAAGNPPATTRNDRPGSFTAATKSPPPASCPVP